MRGAESTKTPERGTNMQYYLQPINAYGFEAFLSYLIAYEDDIQGL
jgi:hypothetical protein